MIFHLVVFGVHHDGKLQEGNTALYKKAADATHGSLALKLEKRLNIQVIISIVIFHINSFGEPVTKGDDPF